MKNPFKKEKRLAKETDDTPWPTGPLVGANSGLSGKTFYHSIRAIRSKGKRVAMHWHCDEPTAMEIGNDVSVEVFEMEFQTPGFLTTFGNIVDYVCERAHKLARKHLRDQGKLVSISDEYANLTLRCRNWWVHPERVWNDNELGRLMQDVVDAMPAKRREVFVLRRDEDLSYKEIAERIHKTVHNVKYHMGLALRDVRTALAEYEGLPNLLLPPAAE